MNGHAGIVKMLVDSGAAIYLPDKVHIILNGIHQPNDVVNRLEIHP